MGLNIKQINREVVAHYNGLHTFYDDEEIKNQHSDQSLAQVTNTNQEYYLLSNQ